MTPTGRPVRAWLVLSRLSNLPTIWTNALAGAVVAGASVDGALGVAALAVSLMYLGGMVLNDVCDVRHDREHRPTRPIPAGDISLASASAAAAALLAAGAFLSAISPPRIVPLAWSGLLVLAIVYYDVRHKRDPLAPLVMGICRGLVYCVVAASLTGAVHAPVVIAAAGVTLYVAAFTLAARHVPAVRPAVSWCIAAISLVDAAVLIAYGHAPLALLAVAAVPVTRLLQRVVPGD